MAYTDLDVHMSKDGQDSSPNDSREPTLIPFVTSLVILRPAGSSLRVALSSCGFWNNFGASGSAWYSNVFDSIFRTPGGEFFIEDCNVRVEVIPVRFTDGAGRVVITISPDVNTDRYIVTLTKYWRSRLPCQKYQ